MTNEFSPTMASLEQTPGYQFTRQQGLQAVTNSYAPQGLAGSITGRSVSPSGPLAAGQTQYASGLASTTFNQQYQNWLAGQQFQLGQRQQQYNMLGGIAGSGQNAAAGLGSLGLQAATGAGNFLTSGAAASAAGTIGAANAAIGGVSGLGGAASNTALLLALNNQGLFGGGGGTVPYSGGYNPANTAVDQNFSAGP
jgi:hypothetical protein